MVIGQGGIRIDLLNWDYYFVDYLKSFECAQLFQYFTDVPNCRDTPNCTDAPNRRDAQIGRPYDWGDELGIQTKCASDKNNPLQHYTPTTGTNKLSVISISLIKTQFLAGNHRKNRPGIIPLPQPVSHALAGYGYVVYQFNRFMDSAFSVFHLLRMAKRTMAIRISRIDWLCFMCGFCRSDLGEFI